MRFAGWSVFIYALIVAAGGVFGFVQAKSTASLFASLPFAITLIISVPGIFLRRRGAIVTSIIAIFLLDAFFTYRFAKSLAWMPAGMMMAASLITLSAMVYGIRKAGSSAVSKNPS